MKKLLIAAMVTASMLAAAVQPAAATGYHSFRYFKHFKHFKKPPAAPKGSVGNGSHSWVPQYVFFATSCSALFLWLQALHTSQTQNRELTQREAWGTIGNCWVPFVGGKLAESLHDNWRP